MPLSWKRSGRWLRYYKVPFDQIREVLPCTVSRYQSAFVEGRQILDATLVANEVVEEARRKGTRGVVFKLDFEKACDRVSCGFLDKVLEKKGFGGQWRQSFLSSFFITLVVDVLSRMLERSVRDWDGGGFKSAQRGRSCCSFTVQSCSWVL